jgi:hypothetical protein
MRLRLAFLLCFLTGVAQGQSLQIDSLERLVGKEGNNRKKVDLLNQLTYQLFDTDIEKAGDLSSQAVQVAR